MRSAIVAFWSEFSEAEDTLATLPLLEHVERANAIMERHFGDLALEISGHDGDVVFDLIVTAHGCKEHFPLLMQLVVAAPVLRRYRVHAFRERTEQPDFPIEMDGFELSTSDVLVACGQDWGQVALEICFGREIPSDMLDQARHMAFILLDHVLGEYDFAVKVGPVDFVEVLQDPLVQWIPLHQFPPVFDRFWTETLGRTGIFPTGEHEWGGMTVMFGGQDDAEDDEPNDEPGNGHDEGGREGDASVVYEDTAIVMLNRSANAVAMRADLTHALTFDLAVPDREALAIAREMQEQAASLLETLQLGILACTVTRAGRRKAVYYVGDEQQARQSIAPLLLRSEVASLETSCRFDPVWEDYFQFAGHPAQEQ